METDRAYRRKNGKSLEQLLMSEGTTTLGMLVTGALSDFGQFIIYRIMGESRRDAHVIKAAMDGLGCADETLLTVISQRSNEQLRMIAKEYASAFREDMFARIKSETGGILARNYGNWVEVLCECQRDETDVIPFNLAMLAQRLYDAGAKKTFGTDDAVFIEIFAKANAPTCAAIVQQYKANFPGRCLITDIEK
jgi:hypothetical protein